VEEVIEYINKLNLYKTNRLSEIEYYIKDKIYIIIELNTNIFVLDNKEDLHKNKYTHIKNIEELNNVIYQKTKIDLNIRLRNYKIDKIINGK